MDVRVDPCRGFTLALLLVSVASSPTAHAQSEPTGPQTNAASESAPAQVGEMQSEPPSKQAPAAQMKAEAPVEALPALRAQRQRREHDLQLALGRVQRERADTSALSAWLFTAVGVGVLVTGLAAGAVGALGCKRSCSTPFWPGWLVVGGATMTTAGVVWIRLKQHDIAELELRRVDLEQELQRVEWSLAAIAPSQPRVRAALSWRASF